jgi:hypothetical protein
VNLAIPLQIHQDEAIYENLHFYSDWHRLFNAKHISKDSTKNKNPLQGMRLLLIISLYYFIFLYPTLGEN